MPIHNTVKAAMQQTMRIAFGLLSLVVEVACETVVVAVKLRTLLRCDGIIFVLVADAVMLVENAGS